MAEKITGQTSLVVLEERCLVLSPGNAGFWARDDGGPRVDGTLTAAKPRDTLLRVIPVMYA
jgi:hypothetical protein